VALSDLYFVAHALLVFRFIRRGWAAHCALHGALGLFVDDDVRLTAAEDAGYNFLARTATRSPAFLASARDAFAAFHVADAFARFA